MISVTEAARNFADCINRVRYQKASFVLHKNGVAVAQIVPAEEHKRQVKENIEQPQGKTSTAELSSESRMQQRDIW